MYNVFKVRIACRVFISSEHINLREFLISFKYLYYFYNSKLNVHEYFFSTYMIV